jgi:hypothetical protein
MARDSETNSSREDVRNAGVRLHRLTHDLSNSLETILQACYLLRQTSLNAASKKWVAMIERAASDAARTNRTLREELRIHAEKSAPKRRAS